MLITIPLNKEFTTMAEVIDHVGREFVREKSKMDKPNVGMKWSFTLDHFNENEVVYKAVQVVRGDDV